MSKAEKRDTVGEPFQQQSLSRAERRAAQERARKRREALEAAIADGGVVATTPFKPEIVEKATKAPAAAEPLRRKPRSLKPKDDVEPVKNTTNKKKRRKPKRNHNARFATGVLVALIGFILALGQGAPILKSDWDFTYLGIGVAVLVAGGFFAWWNSLQARKGVVVLSTILGIVLAAAFAIGAHTSVVINGEVYATTSATAKAYRLSQELRTDLEYIANVDTLLDAEQADARARYSEYTPTATKLAEISGKWAKVAAAPEDLPAPAFAEVASHTANGAHWASEAMTRKQKLIIEPDARGEADVASYRATYIQEVLTAGPQLVEVAKLYGINLIDEGPKE